MSVSVNTFEKSISASGPCAWHILSATHRATLPEVPGGPTGITLLVAEGQLSDSKLINYGCDSRVLSGDLVDLLFVGLFPNTAGD